MPAPPVILSIAGYDPSSGAGVTADIKTAEAFGCYAVTCITALTVQSTQGVFAVEPVASSVVRAMLRRLREDFEVAAVRIGMLGSGAVAAEVANFLEEGRPAHVVLDPVLRSSSGAPLIDEAALDILRKRLLPLSSLITPNGNEAAILAGLPCPGPERQWEAVKSDIRGLAERLHGLGARGVLITGGHIAEPVDYLSIQQSNSRTLCREFAGTHIESRSTHGTGCALATALAGLLGQGVDLPQAVADAKEYVRQAIIHGEPIGKGVGPLKHLYRR